MKQAEHVAKTVEHAIVGYQTLKRQYMEDLDRAQVQLLHAFKEKSSGYKTYLDNLCSLHKGRALELAEAAGKAPYGTWGGVLDPHKVEATTEGIKLSWDIYDSLPNETFVATWEALLA